MCVFYGSLSSPLYNRQLYIFIYFFFRRDPNDYQTHSRPAAREPVPYPGHHHNPPASAHAGRVPPPQAGAQPHNPRHYQPAGAGQQRQRAPLRKDVPPSPGAARRGRHYYEAAGGRVDLHRQASPERSAYGDQRPPDPRRKNPMMGAV